MLQMMGRDTPVVEVFCESRSLFRKSQQTFADQNPTLSHFSRTLILVSGNMKETKKDTSVHSPRNELNIQAFFASLQPI